MTDPKTPPSAIVRMGLGGDKEDGCAREGEACGAYRLDCVRQVSAGHHGGARIGASAVWGLVGHTREGSPLGWNREICFQPPTHQSPRSNSNDHSALAIRTLPYPTPDTPCRVTLCVQCTYICHPDRYKETASRSTF